MSISYDCNYAKVKNNLTGKLVKEFIDVLILYSPFDTIIRIYIYIYIYILFSSPGVDHIPSKLIQAGGGKLYKEIHKLIVLIWNKQELAQEQKEAIIVPLHKKSDRMDCNNYRGISLLSTSYKILSNILLSTMTPYANEIIGENINVALGGIDQPPSTYLAFGKYLKRSGNTIRTYVSYL